jgi:DNA polymerase-3 subunit chi
MKVSFYVLSDSKAQDFLGFTCQLTQTALNKSSQSLLILVGDDEELSSTLDEALWAQEATSFIPHQHLLANNTESDDSEVDINKRLTPVLLGGYMPADFNGIVINTTAQPVNAFMQATSNAQPTRILELIKPDATSVQEGRNKYKAYQQLGYELTHFKV